MPDATAGVLAIERDVEAFSWFPALFEIVADLAFGGVGVHLLRDRPSVGPQS